MRQEAIEDRGHFYKEVRTMEEVMPELDILYMTRVQRERFFNEEDYIRLKDTYILDLKKLEAAKPGPGGLTSAAPGERNHPGSGQRPPRGLF